jgi:hypothetical protein
MSDPATTPATAPWECPRCHCLFERPGFDHEPCRDRADAILAGWREIEQAATSDDQHPGQQAYRGPCTEAGQCLIHRDCPLFGPCAKARALADDKAYEDYVTATYL